MSKIKRNFIILFLAIILLTAIGLGITYQKQTVEFEEFSVEVPLGSGFTKGNTDDAIIKEMYRSYSDDLTITSFDKEYIESEYYNLTGERIDFTESSIENMTSDEANNVTEISNNLTSCIRTQMIDGYLDTDVAVIYHDDTHYIIVEGGDVDFITGIAKSIRILE